MNQAIVNAINNHQVIELQYDGELRIIEPHCYGITTADNEGLRAFQTGGYSSSGTFGWKMYDLSKADNISISENRFDGPRPGYKRGDKGMSTIFAQL
jgi:hypothetical protein